jgi:hypothetical protein
MSITTSSINASRVVAEAYLSIVQDISQNLFAYQNIDINCQEKTKGNLCLGCISSWENGYFKKHKMDLKKRAEFIRNACKTACECSLNNVNMNQNITINFNAFLENDANDTFKTQIMNSINQNAEANNTGVFEFGNRLNDTISTINKIYEKMKTDTVQKSLQTLSVGQNIKIIGPSRMINVNMNQAIDYVSKILISNKETSSLILDLQINILTLTTQVTNAGLQQLIVIIVRIIMLILIIILLLYSINLFIQLYTLYI